MHLNTSTFPKFVDTLNHRFRENGLGYEFNIDALQIIRVDNQAIHQSAIQPALQVLAAREYTHANAELIAAFNDYKKGDYPDCLVKCCSAMESVLKVIIKRERWGGNEVDKETAGPLIARFRNQTGLDSFFEQPLILIANLRNKISPAHGAGDKPKIVPQHFAHYALNATTSAILLLDDHAKYAKSAAGP
ncbi:MAG: hypothetical protein NT069_32865 [Planctomycetota bacterium]|nr:hypothetical protein [Planctomycetota bacterium]